MTIEFVNVSDPSLITTEECTMQLRWVPVAFAANQKKLQQAWRITEYGRTRLEWRDVPTVRP